MGCERKREVENASKTHWSDAKEMRKQKRKVLKARQESGHFMM